MGDALPECSAKRLCGYRPAPRKHTIGFFEVVNGGDIGMVQGRKETGFPFETSQARLVLGEGFGQGFNGDFAAELSSSSDTAQRFASRRKSRPRFVMTSNAWPASSFRARLWKPARVSHTLLPEK